MIEIVLFLLAVYGTSVGSGMAVADRDYRGAGNEARMRAPPLPGSANLNEKALPASKLYVTEWQRDDLPGRENLAERSQIPRELPGTKNLAEKRIPESFLQKLSRPSDTDERL